MVTWQFCLKKSKSKWHAVFSLYKCVYIYIYKWIYICPKVENLFSCTGSCLHLFNVPTKGSCSSITPVEVSTGFVTAKKFPFSGLAELSFRPKWLRGRVKEPFDILCPHKNIWCKQIQASGCWCSSLSLCNQGKAKTLFLWELSRLYKQDEKWYLKGAGISLLLAWAEWMAAEHFFCLLRTIRINQLDFESSRQSVR